jgi:hypothetical protein
VDVTSSTSRGYDNGNNIKMKRYNNIKMKRYCYKIVIYRLDDFEMIEKVVQQQMQKTVRRLQCCTVDYTASMLF